MHGLAKRQALSFVNFVPAVVAYCVCQALPAEFTQPGAQRLAVPYSPTDHAHIAALCLPDRMPLPTWVRGMCVFVESAPAERRTRRNNEKEEEELFSFAERA